MLPVSLVRIWSSYFFFLSLFAVFLTLIGDIGIYAHGASRWLKIFGLSVQPSEFLKVSSIFFFSSELNYRVVRGGSIITKNLYLFASLLLAVFFLLKQPDFGSAVMMIFIVMVILFVRGFDLTKLFWTAVALLPVAAALVYVKKYRLSRFLIFLNPWADPEGAGFQIIQSLVSIGSGGLFGVGVGLSRQKFLFLPLQHTDFILAIIAEETGFFGIFCLALLYFLFLVSMLRTSFLVRGEYERSVMIVFAVFVVTEALINMLVVSGMLPTKGIALPFVSYGGSALLARMLALGAIAGIVYEER
jgi:cell division protein FtsW